MTDQNNSSEYGRIFRIRTDGTGRQQLGDQESMTFALAGDWIYHIKAADQKLYRFRTDGSGNARVLDSAVVSFSILDGYVYYLIGENESNTLWRMKLDGSDAMKLTDDRVGSFNPSGDWIYYGRLKPDNKGLELKKMQLDGAKAAVINDDNPFMINVLGDRLLYLGMDSVTDISSLSFTMKQTLIRLDGSGRKDFPIVPKSPLENVKVVPMKTPVKGGDITVTVQSAYSTNILKRNDPQIPSPIFDDVFDWYLLFVNMTITNNSDRQIDIRQLIGRFEIQDVTNYSTRWHRKADVTTNPGRKDSEFHLDLSAYSESLVFQPHETKEVQILDHLQQKGFPVLLTLMDRSGSNALASISVTPTAERYVVSRSDALEIMKKRFPGSDIAQRAGMGFKFDGETKEAMYYTFRVRKSGSSTAVFYLVKRDTGEIFVGAYSARYPNWEAVPVSLLK